VGHQVPVQDREDRASEADEAGLGPVAAQQLLGRDVVEQHAPGGVADDHRDAELRHERGESVPFRLEVSPGCSDLLAHPLGTVGQLVDRPGKR
jgi:hypothetical protein